MANTIELIIKATDKASAIVASVETKITTSANKTVESLDKVRKSSGESEGAWSKLQSSVVTANQAFDLIGRGIGTVSDVIDKTIGSTMAYAAQVRELSRNLGISAEETSKIIQASDDYGISVESITGALEMAVKRGFAPNIETLAKLADEYNSITNPIERAARLSEVFGKSWTSLTPILAAGGDAIRASAQEAENLGLVLSEQDVKAARALEVGMDNLGDRVESIKLKIGKGLIPVLTSAADSFLTLVSWSEQLDAALKNVEKDLITSGASYEAYQAGALGAAVAAGKITQAQADQIKSGQAVTEGMWSYADAAAFAADRTGLLSREGYKSALAQKEYADKVRNTLDDLKGLIDTQKKATDSSVSQGIDNIARGYTAMGKAIEESQKKAQSAFDATKLAIGGEVSRELDDYNKKQDDLAKRAEEVKQKIDELTRSHGKLDESQSRQAATTAELNLWTAQLARSQSDLTKETDPLKQAELAARIEDLRGKISESSHAVRVYIDNTKEIGNLKNEYRDINLAVAENADEHEKATKRILLGYAEQQLAVDGLSTAELQALNKLAQTYGIVDSKTAAAFDKTLKATEQFSKTNNIDQFQQDMTLVYDDVSGKTETFTATTAGAQKKLEEMGILVLSNTKPAVDQLTSTYDRQRASVDLLNASLYKYQTYSVPQVVTTPTTHTPYTQGERITGYAGGADFVVPPGFPGDSYPMRVSSGEHVQVTSAGGAAGGMIINIPQTFYGAESSPEKYRAIMYEVISDVMTQAEK